jgi:WD40 repeat protein
VSSDQFKPVGVFDLKVWDVASGELRHTFIHASEGLNVSTDHFALSADGSTLAFEDNSARRPMQVKMAEMRDERHTFEVAYNMSPGLCRVKFWNVPQWKEIGVVDGGPPLVFSPDGKTLITGAQRWKDPSAKVWDAATGRLRAEFDSGGPWVKPLTFSPDGNFLAIGATMRQSLYELSSGRKWMVAAEGYGDHAPVFSPDGGLLFPNGLPRGTPSLNMNQAFPCYDVSALPPRRVELGDGQVVTQPIRLNEPLLIISAAARRYAAFGEADGRGVRTVVVRDLPDRKELCRFTVIGLREARFSPEGRWLSVWAGRELQLLDPATGRAHVTVPTPEPVWDGPRWRFSPDGKLLAVTYTKGSASDPDVSERPRTVDLWDVQPR